MGFERPVYTFYENSTDVMVTVTIRRENQVTVSSPFELNVLLLSGSTAIEGLVNMNLKLPGLYIPSSMMRL